jgi:predicted small secreted protein
VKLVKISALLIAALSLAGCDKLVERTGRVIDSDGNPISNAAIYIFSPDTNQVSSSPDTWTDANGQFELQATVPVMHFRSSNIEIIVSHDDYYLGRLIIESDSFTGNDLFIRLPTRNKNSR